MLSMFTLGPVVLAGGLLVTVYEWRQPALDLPATRPIHPVKRLFDVCFAGAVLVLGAPVLLLLAAISWLSSPGPAIYRQERIGCGGRPFMIYKFRSMYVNAEAGGPMLSAGLGDARITPWGRFMRQTRLDELPQFLNVLLGDMSVVGPRPERQFYIDRIMAIDPSYAELLQVKPGITSIGQVRFGYADTVSAMIRRMRYDQEYLNRQTARLDLWIIGQTIKIMFQARGQ
jgi:lipopolysaccharide/colanic/teichoic acid biosynthesis glycosyltransferase